MRNLFLFGLLIGSLMLTACTPSPQAVEQANNETQANFDHPQAVGKLPDGREVFVVYRKLPNMSKSYNHAIYFVGCTTTTQAMRNSVKSTVTDTTVNLDACHNPLVSR